jgi:O-antigen/teichoic acid export membrane protein
MLKSLFKDSVVYTIPTVVSRGISILLVPLYTRVLTPADYGAFDMINVVASLVWLTVALEVTQAVARHYPDETSEDGKITLTSTALWFTVVTHTMFLALAQILAPFASKAVLGVDGLTPAFRLGLVHIWLNGIFIALQNQFRWELRSRQYTIMALVKVVATALASVLLTYVLRLGLIGFLLGLATGTVCGGIYGITRLTKSFRLRFDTARLRRMLRFSAPLVPSGIAVFVSNYINRFMLRHFLSLSDVGVYGVGFRLASIVSLVMIGFQTALTPLIYTHHQDAETPGSIATAFRVFVSLAAPMLLALVVFAPEILRIFSTPDFYPAYRVVMFLAPGVLLSRLYVFAPGLGIKKRTHWMLWINVGSATVNAILNWIMIPRFGYVGAAIATTIGYVCAFIAYMVISQRLYHVPHAWGRIGVAVALFLAAAYAGSQLTSIDVLSIAMKSGLVVLMTAAVLAVRLVSVDEIKRVLGTVKRRRK